MTNKDDEKPDLPAATDDKPFVTDECGDTMWDEVLKDAEERMKKTFAPKPAEDAPKAEKET